MKQKYDVIQFGDNPDYPRKALIWSPSEQPDIPEWFSDRAKINKIGEDGKLELGTRKTTGGEIEILDSSGLDVLVKLKTHDSYVLFSETHPMLSLTPHQLELLYEFNIRR